MAAAVPLFWFLLLGAALFCAGLYGVLANRNLVTVTTSLELMLGAVVLNLVAFARYVEPVRVTGTAFAIVVYAAAAAEAALGLALAVAVWRTESAVAVEERRG
jgi:NAD(P)H-quinone oxidoreductase subunit 4L